MSDSHEYVVRIYFHVTSVYDMYYQPRSYSFLNFVRKKTTFFYFKLHKSERDDNLSNYE